MHGSRLAPACCCNHSAAVLWNCLLIFQSLLPGEWSDRPLAQDVHFDRFGCDPLCSCVTIRNFQLDKETSGEPVGPNRLDMEFIAAMT